MMSRRRSSGDSGGAMPATGAGLIRFFEEDTPGIKIGPYAVMIFAIILIIAVLLGTKIVDWLTIG